MPRYKLLKRNLLHFLLYILVGIVFFVLSIYIDKIWILLVCISTILFLIGALYYLPALIGTLLLIGNAKFNIDQSRLPKKMPLFFYAFKQKSQIKALSAGWGTIMIVTSFAVLYMSFL